MGNLQQAHPTHQLITEERHTALVVIANCERGGEPNLDHVRLLCAMGQAGRLGRMATLAATSLAQHCLLRDERKSAERLGELIDQHWAEGRQHTAFIRYVAEHLDRAPEPGDLKEQLTRAVGFPGSVVSAFHVVLTVRLIVRHQLEASWLADVCRALCLDHTGDRAGAMIQACVDISRADGRFVPATEVDRIASYFVFDGVMDGPAEARGAATARVCDRLAAAMKAWIDENWFTNSTLEEYAISAGRSPKTIARRFKRAFGCSPKQYQQEKRIEEAKSLMGDTSWSLTDIAYECGFYDSAQFSRLFKTATGLAPSAYRIQIATGLVQGGV